MKYIEMYVVIFICISYLYCRERGYPSNLVGQINLLKVEIIHVE